MPMFLSTLRWALGLSAILFCFPASQTGATDEWIDLISAEVSSDWSPNASGHWLTGGTVLLPAGRPDRLELKPGVGLLFAPGETKSMEANMASKKYFGDIRLQVEFLIPRGSNSGIYLMGRYELQIRDSYGKSEMDSHDCGAIYQRWDDSRGKGQEGFEGHVPRVNACKPAGEWQSFDIEFRAPRFDQLGRKIADAEFVRVKQNGILIHTNASLSGPTRGALFETESATGPILLQGNHGPIVFRKLRVLEPPTARADPARDAAEHPDRPNFVVFFCDNLGYGDIEPFGSTVHRTPHLNRMAREGRCFTHFYVTAGVCTPSRASLMTGCYSQRVGMHFNPRDGQVLRPVSPYGLHPNEVTIAEVLKPLGYATTIIGKWHLGDQPEFLPTRQGFDSYLGIPYSDNMTGGKVINSGGRTLGVEHPWPPLPLMENETVIDAPVDRDYLTKRYTQRALQFIDQNEDRPFFLYFPQAMPGSEKVPFASPAFKGQSRNGLWGDSIEELDWSTGQVLDKLVELGIDHNTLVIWTSDNGAPLASDVSSLARGSNLPLHGRGYTTAEGAFRVPTIAWWPGKIPANTTCDEMATTMDLLPTLARLAGGREPTDRIIDGYDIRPLLFGDSGASSPYEVFYYYSMQQLQAVRSGPWKLFVPVEGARSHPHFSSKQRPRPLLFNLIDDVSCEHNVADQHPAIVVRLTELAELGRAELGDLNQPGRGQRPAGFVSQVTPRRLKPPDEGGF